MRHLRSLLLEVFLEIMLLFLSVLYFSLLLSFYINGLLCCAMFVIPIYQFI